MDADAIDEMLEDSNQNRSVKDWKYTGKRKAIRKRELKDCPKEEMMKSYSEMSKEELMQEKQSLEQAYADYQKMDLSLNMARGKPAPAQLDLANDLLTAVSADELVDEISGLDTRNYGGLDGIPEAKELIASMVDAKADQVIVFGNSSLNTMYDQVARGMLTGYCGETPWCKLPEVKWICPVPGYDRHFAVTEHFGIRMINVPMSEDGPDMDMVEELVKDPAVKGMWNVPKYSNPQGYVYSEEVTRRIANLKPAAKDFRVFWDNAYCVHHLYAEDEKRGHLLNILDLCEKAGNPDLVFEFVSTSKVSYAGGGIAGIVTSENNKKDILASMTVQTIGYDKVNQLRHARFFDNGALVEQHMMKHASILRPKFELVEDKFSKNLAGLGVGSWTKPLGGYFVTYTTLPGCATRTIQLAKEAGVVMTGAGAPFPYHKDPEDSTIRVSPSYPSLEELGQALDVFAVCVKLAAVEKLLA